MRNFTFGKKECKLLIHKPVLRKMSIRHSIIQLTAICQTISLGPQRDSGRMKMRQCALPSGFTALVNLLILGSHSCVSGCVHKETCIDEHHEMHHLFFNQCALFHLPVPDKYLLAFLVKVLRKSEAFFQIETCSLTKQFLHRGPDYSTH